MKTAKELFGTEDGTWYTDYQPILEQFGSIAVQVDDCDYQGDSRILYHDGDNYGYLQFGWGSCSGCDWLQGCDTIQEVQELMDHLLKSIIWFSSKDEAIKYFKEHDWGGDYSWHEEEQRDFINKVLVYLGEEAIYEIKT